MRSSVTSRGLASICALGLAIGLSACERQPGPMTADDPATTPPPTTYEEPATTTAQQDVRLTGCLERGEIGGTFILTEARREDPGMVGTTGDDVGPAQTYTLTDAADVNLAGHVGERVSVTGRLGTQPGMQADPGTQTYAEPGTTAAPGEPGRMAEGTAGARPQIVVQEIERISNDCPAE